MTATENQHTQISTSTTTLTTLLSTRGQSSINSFIGPKKFHPQMQSALEEDPRHQSAKGQQLPSEFYPELQVLWQLPPPRFEYQRLFQRNASSASLFVVFPYVRGVTKRISRVLRNNGVKVGYKPFRVLRTCFLRPKDKPSSLQCRGVVYKVGCVECNFDV